MSKAKINLLLAFALLIFGSSSCNQAKNGSQNEGSGNSIVSTSNAKTSTKVDADDTASTSGAERVKPAAGKGNVQGKFCLTTSRSKESKLKSAKSSARLWASNAKVKPRRLKPLGTAFSFSPTLSRKPTAV